MRKNKDSQWRNYLDCSRCELSRRARRHLHCGHEPAQSWQGKPFWPPEWPIDPECCPGYLLDLPQVEETARAFTWFEKGMLKERYAGHALTSALMDALEILQGQMRAVESFAMESAALK